MTRFSLHLGDATTWLRSLDDESVDLVVTDPAYASLEKHRAKGTTTRLSQSDASSNEWFATVPNGYFSEFFWQIERVLKDDAHAYVITDEETMCDVVRPFARRAGLVWWKSIVWVKTTKEGATETLEDVAENVRIGMGYHWRNSTERVSFIEKGKRRLRHLGWPDVIGAPRVDGGYPTEKPPSLLERLIENSSEPGQLVIDPFMGSASTGEAALRLGRAFAGSDVSKKAVDLARARLSPLGPEGVVTRALSQGDLFG
jgi:site-specific DNA-methyltransferase (adenine-specific)